MFGIIAPAPNPTINLRRMHTPACGEKNSQSHLLDNDLYPPRIMACSADGLTSGLIAEFDSNPELSIQLLQ
jgi:hypothetical protein